MAHERLGKEEILEKFIISATYGTREAFPYGDGSAIVLSKVSCQNNNGDGWAMVSIHRNRGQQMHAETKLVQLLEDISAEAKEIRQLKIEMIQNFSPCNNKDNDGEDAFCAQKIVKYKTEMEKQGKQIDICITFANFYRTVVFYGNDANRAEQNRQGLRLLRDNGVHLRLLCGEKEWRKLLNDDELFSLSEKDRKSCLKKAASDERKKREDFDKTHLKEILSTSAASALADNLKTMQLTKL